LAIVNGEDSWADLERLTPAERTAVDDVLVGWATTGPPRDRTPPPPGFDGVNNTSNPATARFTVA
jgi:hypothetical protein